ncbi:MAG: hypothetical protein M0013_05955 [Actinomycetota bacterium]|jgi:hypothetical protein|nr:hypothetical protein [Actinomycetota bacterium]
MAKHLKPGDKVVVPFGLDEIVGTVVEVYGPPKSKSVYVRLPVHGPSGEVLEEYVNSFPERVLRAVTAA